VQTDEEEITITLIGWEWDELCERGNLHCRVCKETPSIWDAQVFVSEGTCGHCTARLERLASE
jgi:hypothetical protein